MPGSARYGIRLVRVHAPELITTEPQVVYGEGMAAHAIAHGAEGLQASIDAANVLLERITR